ncbi:hypothetical protein AB9F26_13470 [Falsihalocynthiibacter sp. BN13B15]|uniref:hypothetical protein n=1 Tax=Falsihalocynthiibacter sp. BN13B15 TaxID=3240871 RepID=UPI0035106B37
MVSPEAELWIAVVALAVKDALKGDATAQRWIAGQGRDMRETCSLAGSDSSMVHRAALKLGAIGVEQAGPHIASQATQKDLSAGLLQRLAALREVIEGRACVGLSPKGSDTSWFFTG